MLAMDEILSEIQGEDRNELGLPPGFRFHPTDEELVTFYLASKVFNGNFCGVNFAELDLNRYEPWELPDMAKMGEREWYFFSLRDRKYPKGLRTNRATQAGFWKASGKDKEIYSSSDGALLGMKKTLVFYEGRSPGGQKTKWAMHEYRLDGHFSFRHTCVEEWVICRIYLKEGGDKKTPLSQVHSCLLEASSSTPISLPPQLQSTTLLDPPSQIQTLQNPYIIHAPPENNLNTLIDAGVSQPQQHRPVTAQPSFSLPTNTNPSPSILFESLPSHQEFSSEEPAITPTIIPGQWNEATFYHFQPLNVNLQCADNIHPNLWKNTMFFGMGFSDSAADTVHHEMSTSVILERTSFQTILDPSIRGFGETLDA